jgi:hypothetical protein
METTFCNKTDIELAKEKGDLLKVLGCLALGLRDPAKSEVLAHIRRVMQIDSELEQRTAVDNLRLGEMIHQLSDHRNRLQNFLLRFIVLCRKQRFTPAIPLAQSYREYLEAYRIYKLPTDGEFRVRVEGQIERESRMCKS